MSKELERIPQERIRVDCYLLADAAQESNGKLFILGGGWSQIHVAGPDVAVPSIALAMRVVVPWGETNRNLRFEIQLEDLDRNKLLGDAPVAEIAVGRPPDLPPGSEQPVPLALTFNNLVFQRPGNYMFTISLDDVELNRAVFTVLFPGENRPV